MKFPRLLALGAVCFLPACLPAASPTVTIIDNQQIHTLQSNERVLAAWLSEAGITLSPNDRLLLNGLPVALQEPVSAFPVTLQLRRAVPITILMPEGEKQVQSSVFTIGEVLQENSIWLRAEDVVDPPLDTPLQPSGEEAISTITIYPASASNLTITSNGTMLRVNSSAQTVGEALAEAGMPLLGLDYSIPPENERLPADGQIRVVRVSESVQLAQQPIPFESELQASADVALDQTRILQPGEQGLTVQRIRIRYEDGKEISRVTEDETLVRPPKTRLLAYGTKIEVQSAVVDGVSIEYWRAVQMYATSYSPCRSGADRCYPGTSSGKSLRKGMVALRYSWYLNMQGQQLYIPGYGVATVEDVCGGCVGRPWIDLGYSDHDFEPWHSWVTVYFLTPVPANVIQVLE